jgi:hypothetical protein
MEYVNQAVQTLHDGFLEINHPKGLLIALAATLFMSSWRQWLPVALVATVIHIAIDVLAPVLAGRGSGNVALPDFMQASFWETAGIYFLGYLIIIGVFFFLKSLLFRGGSTAKAH